MKEFWIIKPTKEIDKERWLNFVNYLIENREDNVGRLKKEELKKAAEAAGYTLSSAQNQMARILKEEANGLRLDKKGCFVDPKG